MDGIQAYHGPSRPSGLPATTGHPSSTKVASDYLRALKRRIWLVMAVAVPLSIAGAVWTARLPNIYCAKTQILIEPPQFDPYLSTLVTHNVAQRDPEQSQTYAPNRIAMLKNKALAEKVVNDPRLTQGGPPSPEAGEDLAAAVQTKEVPKTSQYIVSLEGTDPARTQKILQFLLEEFQLQAQSEIDVKLDSSRSYAETSLRSLELELGKLTENIQGVLKQSEIIGPEGKNLKAEQYNLMTSMLLNDHSRVGDLQQQEFLSQSIPDYRVSSAESARADRIGRLEFEREELTIKMKQMKRRIRYFDSDPSATHLADKLQRVMDRLTQLRAAADGEGRSNPYEVILESKKSEIRAREEAAKSCLLELRDSMPEHQRFLDLIDAQKRTVERIAAMQTKLSDFKIVSKSKREPITLLAPVAEPLVPIRPKRAMNLAVVLFLSFGLGIGLVCLLEHVDHTVKAPEQLAAGLTLPLFGVIPRIRRTASIHRGGHLWTPGAPISIEADAFRNLRASLLGLSDKRGPIVTLLVTSARAGEGKSTTALNLAATCARAGERTLLMDVDLRRPSLADVFRGDDSEPAAGIVDVLRGALPWQRTVVRTDIPNLDFLPTGDTREVPIEVLGTLELRQLLIGLSNHYDRVILDGPAILGLADCRMLGRVVDAALLVVRSGSQEIRPLQHAKAMLEQSQVTIAGVVFNGLFEDLKNWSSYGPDTPYGYTDGAGNGRSRAAAGGLAAPSDEHAALPLAGASRS